MGVFKYCLLTFIFALLFSCTSTTLDVGAKSPVTVVEVHDGDTVSIKTRTFLGISLSIERVRLIGIDAPEIKQEPWGTRAKRHLKRLINESGGVVYLELDIDRRDKYGRILAYLWDKNGRMLNQKMLEDGYALLYTVPPNVKYVDILKEAQQKARLNKTGIWGRDGLKKSPEEWRKENPRK